MPGHRRELSSGLHEPSLLPENITGKKEKGIMAPEPAKMLIGDIVQKADRRGNKTNGPTGAVHIPRQTAAAAAERAGMI